MLMLIDINIIAIQIFLLKPNSLYFLFAVPNCAYVLLQALVKFCPIANNAFLFNFCSF